MEIVKHRYGCKVAIDDFGSGYSNFEHLLELDFDYLKIDGTIISKITTHNQSMVLLEAILAFTQKLGISTIAEYVSDASILKIIEKKGVNYAQGFHIGRPKEKIPD